MGAGLIGRDGILAQLHVTWAISYETGRVKTPHHNMAAQIVLEILSIILLVISPHVRVRVSYLTLTMPNFLIGIIHLTFLQLPIIILGISR